MKICLFMLALSSLIGFVPGKCWSQNSSLLHAPAPEMVPAPSAVRSGGPSTQQNALDAGRTVVPPEYVFESAARQPMSSITPLGLPDHDPAVGLRGVSWTYQQAPPLRQFRVQDIITIRVDEITRMQAEGEAEKRRNSIFTAVLADWLRLTRNGLVPDPQDEGDPTVAAQSQSNFRAQSRIQSRESLTFNVAARIVDIRPNGNLVLEARKKFRHNDNLWETSLSGICRAQDIGPDNVVLSKDLIDLEIHKEDQGQLRDGYARGWFQKAMDRVKLF